MYNPPILGTAIQQEKNRGKISISQVEKWMVQIY